MGRSRGTSRRGDTARLRTRDVSWCNDAPRPLAQPRQANDFAGPGQEGRAAASSVTHREVNAWGLNGGPASATSTDGRPPTDGPNPPRRFERGLRQYASRKTRLPTVP
jgi:hypothetical protein